MKHTQHEQNKIIGLVTVKRLRAGTIDKARKLIVDLGHELAKPLIDRLFHENLIGIGAKNNNLVVSSSNRGRNLIAQHLGDYLNSGLRSNYPLAITYAELGTSATTPTNSDTQLGSASDRKSTDLATVTGNVVTLSFFWADGDLADGTYNEFGTFTGGTATLNSGQLFNHALFSPSYEKAAGEDTTIEVEFTIN